MSIFEDHPWAFPPPNIAGRFVPSNCGFAAQLDIQNEYARYAREQFIREQLNRRNDATAAWYDECGNLFRMKRAGGLNYLEVREADGCWRRVME